MPQSVFILSPLHHALLRIAHGCSAVLLAMTGEIVALQRLSRERTQLAEMDQAALKDIGLTAVDVAAELDKPVWKR